MSDLFDRLRLNFRYAFDPRKPLLTLRLAKAVLQSYIFKKPPLRYVDFAIDFACNLRCEHCFATALQNPGRPKMKVEDYQSVAEQAMQMGAVNFSFQGGEPLLFKNLPDIIHAVKPDRNVISVTTNGTLLTTENVRVLKKTGVNILTISLDSAIAAEHDSFRGAPGTFEKTVAGIHLAMQEGLRVTLGTVVTHQSIHSEGIQKLIELAKEWKVLLYIILPVPAGRWTDNTDMFLTKEDLTYIDDLTSRSPYIRTDFQANFGPNGCGAVKEILYLTPYGDVLSCPFIHISLGNIFKDTLRNIRQKALEIPWFSHYHQECLASTDKIFIRDHLSKTFNVPGLPLPLEEAFPNGEARLTGNDSNHQSTGNKT